MHVFVRRWGTYIVDCDAQVISLITMWFEIVKSRDNMNLHGIMGNKHPKAHSFNKG